MRGLSRGEACSPSQWCPFQEACLALRPGLSVFLERGLPQRLPPVRLSVSGKQPGALSTAQRGGPGSAVARLECRQAPPLTVILPTPQSASNGLSLQWPQPPTLIRPPRQLTKADHSLPSRHGQLEAFFCFAFCLLFLHSDLNSVIFQSFLVLNKFT